jgi:PAS domain S-box-containing protein
MKRPARSGAKPKKKSPAAGSGAGASTGAPAGAAVRRRPRGQLPPPARTPERAGGRLRQGVVREIVAADTERGGPAHRDEAQRADAHRTDAHRTDAHRNQARVAALEIDNAQQRDFINRAEGAIKQYLAMLETVVGRNNANQREIADLRQEVAEKTQALAEKNTELERNLIEKEGVRAFLSNILESLPVGVLVTDRSGGITGLNRVAKAILGREASTLLGENVNNLMGPELKLESEGGTDWRDPVTYKRPDGEALKLEVSVTRMPGEGGQQPGYVVNLQDVTLLKKLEEQSARRNRFTVMGEMAANIAHEIRNPLGSIELFASLVRKGLPEEDEKTGLMNRISSAITSMNHIISNVLEYTKPRAVTLKELDLHTLLRELEGFFSFQCEQNGVTLTLGLAAPDTWIRADREMLKQVFHNLLLNAVQAMPEGGTLTLATRRRAVSNVDLLNRLGRAPGPDGGILNVLEVTVRDTGVGMPPDISNRIFDPFFTTKSRGTGLGLAITHTIVEAHQATIDVDSRVGQGTAFVLMFPLLRG